MKASAPWLAALAAAIVAQLAVPATMIVRREMVLRAGVPFKFRTAPVDPVDAFRGRYIALDFEERCASLPPGVAAPNGAQIDVRVETGADGFARLRVMDTAPKSGEPYLRLHAAFPCTGGVSVEIPFNRFYMQEGLASDAERAYREHSRGPERDAYASVRVQGGVGVVEDVYVGGRPIGQWLRAERAQER